MPGPAVDFLRAESLAIGHPGVPPLLRDVSFGVQAGRALVVLGANGSGKSTLLRCLLGLMRPLAGGVRIDGHDVHRLAPLRRAALMAYVPQSGAATFPFDVREVVLMGRSRHLRFLRDPDRRDHDAVRAALERVGIGHLAERRFDTLSGGERQLALLARALAQDAPCVLLDEPCASLDPGHQVAVLDALRDVLRRGTAVVMASHLPEHAWALDAQALLIARGRVEGPAPASSLLDSATLSRVYDTPIEALTLSQGAAAGQRVLVPLALQSLSVRSPMGTSAESSP